MLNVEMKPAAAVGPCMGRRCSASQVMVISGIAGRIVLCDSCLREMLQAAMVAGFEPDDSHLLDVIEELEAKVEACEEELQDRVTEIGELENKNSQLTKQILQLETR